MQVRVKEQREEFGACGCGRSPNGKCCGWHGLTEDEYQLELEKYEAKNLDNDFNDNDERPEDPDSDKIPHIFMQLKKAIDVDGNYPIKFKDGTSTKLNMNQIAKFVKKYMSAKPVDKEAMQNTAIKSLEDFMNASEMNVSRQEPSIYNH